MTIEPGGGAVLGEQRMSRYPVSRGAKIGARARFSATFRHFSTHDNCTQTRVRAGRLCACAQHSSERANVGLFDAKQVRRRDRRRTEHLRVESGK